VRAGGGEVPAAAKPVLAASLRPLKNHPERSPGWSSSASPLDGTEVGLVQVSEALTTGLHIKVVTRVKKIIRANAAIVNLIGCLHRPRSEPRSTLLILIGTR